MKSANKRVYKVLPWQTPALTSIQFDYRSIFNIAYVYVLYCLGDVTMLYTGPDMLQDLHTLSVYGQLSFTFGVRACGDASVVLAERYVSACLRASYHVNTYSLNSMNWPTIPHCNIHDI